MTYDINTVTIRGNLGQDPKFIPTKTGKEFASLRVATNYRYTDKKTGEVTETTEWHNLVTFNPYIVELIRETFKKGDRIQATGKLRTRKTDRGYEAEVIMDDAVVLLPRSPKEDTADTESTDDYEDTYSDTDCKPDSVTDTSL